MYLEAQDPPKLSFAGANPNTKYVVVSLDIDAPFPSFSVLGPILHWIQSDVTVTDSSSLEFDAPFVANYIGPAPPPGSAPHRYIFFLYEQPETFNLKDHAPADGKNLSNMSRMRYNLDAWAEEAKLGPLVAFNYFFCNWTTSCCQADLVRLKNKSCDRTWCFLLSGPMGNGLVILIRESWGW